MSINKIPALQTTIPLCRGALEARTEVMLADRVWKVAGWRLGQLRGFDSNRWQQKVKLINLAYEEFADAAHMNRTSHDVIILAVGIDNE